MMSFRTGLPLIAMILIVLSCAGCAEVATTTEEGGLFGVTSTPTVTETSTPSYVTVETPMSTLSPGATAEPTHSKPPGGSTGQEYVVIYSETHAFNYDVVALSFNLVRPPLVIEVTVHPEMVEDVKEGDSSYGDKDESYVVTKQVPHDLAEFKLAVYDKNSEEVIDEILYGRTSTYMEEQTVSVLASGLYQIEMTGSYVDADVTISVPPDNIPDK